MPRIIKIVLALLLLLLISITTLFYQINSAFNQPLNIVGSKLVVVEKGQYAHFVINRLAEQALLSDPLLIKAALKIEPEYARIKAGTYEIKLGMSARDFFNDLVNGNEKTYQISLIEGLKWSQWLTQLNNHPNIQASDKNEQQWVNWLDPDIQGGSLEGWLLPDTYQFTAGTRTEDIVKRAYVAMTEYLQQAWTNRALVLPYETPYEALIMASIIEKETGVAHERPRISGVFINRLRDNMRLQTDPTVIYGMGDSFDGNIRRQDLRQATPYNTYVIKGLPPTPIAMPGKQSIDAAMNPLETDEYYFVSKGDGTHKFSTTLKEHNLAVRKYQLKK